MLKLLNCLVCDDVRQESSGKFILIGVYGADLNVLQLAQPNSTTMLNLWMELETEKDQAQKLQLRAIIEGDDFRSQDTAFEFNIDLSSSASKRKNLAVQFDCRVDFSHCLRFELKSDENEWQFARRLQVNTPSSSPPMGTS